tara:strand:- start:284 stop:397 length:114 start_codon:yes stop_codon:yes gene_type:complete
MELCFAKTNGITAWMNAQINPYINKELSFKEKYKCSK